MIPIYIFLTVALNTIIHFEIFVPCLLETAPYISNNSSFQVCDTQEDDWAEEVQIRLSHPRAASNLHSVDARYQNDCKLKFMAGETCNMQTEKQAINLCQA